MHGDGLFGRGRMPGADGPHRFVGNGDRIQFPGAQLCKPGGDLTGHDRFRASGLTLIERFAHAEDRTKSVGQAERTFL